jgi:hypothetical protein
MLIDELRSRWNEALSYRGRCPKCDGERVWHNGIRLRKAVLVDGDETIFVPDIPARRLRCAECGARWTHAPECVSSRGQHQPCVVARAVARLAFEDTVPVGAVAAEHRCHRRSLGRWLARVAGVADPAMLAAAVLRESATPVLPSPPVVVRRTPSPRLLALMGRAVWVLALLEALATLHGLSPPGLAHARVLVPADAPSGSGVASASSRCERDTGSS